MATAIVYSDATAVDGYVGRQGANEAFATLISSAGNTNNSTFNTSAVGIRAQSTAPFWRDCYRGVFLFNVYAALPAGATISAATLDFYVVTKTADNFSASLVLTNAPVGSYTALANSDYQNLYGTPIEHATGRIALASFAAADTIQFTLNPTALTTAQSTLLSGNVFELAVRIDYDFDGNTPAHVAGGSSRIDLGTVEQALTARRPTLTITYTTGLPTPEQVPQTPAGGAPTVPPAPPPTSSSGGTSSIPGFGGGETTTGQGGGPEVLTPAPLLPAPLVPDPIVNIPFPKQQDPIGDRPRDPEAAVSATVKVILQDGTPMRAGSSGFLRPGVTTADRRRRYRGGPPMSKS